METVLRILMLEDFPHDAELETLALRRAGIACESRRVESREEFLEQVENFDPHVILSDFSLPGFDGLSALRLASERRPEIPFIFVSGTIGEERAIEALKNGATDYVLKTNLVRLPSSVARAVREAEERQRRIREEARSVRVGRIRALHAAISSAIVRVGDPRELYQRACDAAVKQGGFIMAWVADIILETPTYRAVASSGHDAGYLEEAVRQDQNGMPRYNLIAEALRQRRTIAVEDIAADERFPLKAEALARGYRSKIALPLTVANDVIAVLTIYAGERGFFGQEEAHLLSELAGDISFALDYRAKQQWLSHLAYHDALTGLSNRQLLYEHLKQEVAHANRSNSMIAVVFVDLDRFKEVNDTFGHNVGDRVLKEVSARILACTREGDIVARLGGDEFVMVLPNQQSSAAVVPAIERVLASVSQPMRIEDREVSVTCSVGVALYPDDGTNSEVLMRNADAAMYYAKNSGGHQFRFCPRGSGMDSRQRSSLYWSQ